MMNRRFPVVVGALAWSACASDYDVTEQARRLETESLTVDAGLVAVGERAVIPLFLASTGPGRLTVWDVAVEDDARWEVRSGWATEDTDEDGAPDAVVVDGGSAEAPSFALVELVFKPDAEGIFRTVLTVTSNDTEVTDRTDDDQGLWRVVLRGRARFPCGAFVPGLVDYGPRPPGGFFAAPVAIENCGPVPLTISNFTVEGDTSFTVATATPLTVLPGEVGDIEVAFEPGGGAPPAAARILPVSASPDFNAVGLGLRGNTCAGSAHPAWDADGDGFTVCAGDCAADDASIRPGAAERPANGIDDNCDGQVDEAPDDLADDADGDGLTEEQGDCHDGAPEIRPGAPETLDGRDEDCDGVADDGTAATDDDGDGFSEEQGDCDDALAARAPGTAEADNGEDDDCDGVVDEGGPAADDDGDSSSEDDGDCDDGDPWVGVGAVEDCDDVDNDCDGAVDEGEDDAPGGACAFRVEREAAQVSAAKGCAHAPLPVAAVAILGGLGALLRRRRPCPTPAA